jgi:photosystem II stability/assembly factor-like uncharacterized protein
MKRSKLFLLAAVLVVLAWTGSSYAQWTLCPGSISLTGMGQSPSVSVPSPLVAWVAGGASNSPKVMRTTNGGTTFVNVTGNMTATPEPWCIWAVDANTAYVGDGGAGGGAGGNAKVWKTTNGGTSWTVILSTGGTAGFINSIVFSKSNPQFGLIQSDPPSGPGQVYWLQKTTDGGATWTLMAPAPPGVTGQASSQNGLAIASDNIFGFGLGNLAPARCRLTNNGGTAWTLGSTTVVTGGFIGGLAINSNGTTILMATDASMPNIARSTDFGTTWAAVNTGAGLTGYCTIKYVVGTNIAYLTGGTGTNAIRKTTDNGVTWTPMTTGGIASFTHMEYCLVSGVVTGYAIASDGSCVTLAADPVGIDPKNTNVPKDYSLEQNFPNPFNPVTNIRYSLPKASNESIKIYDMLGHEVMTVVNTHQEAGNYIENVDASNLASGVYFYTIKAGDFTDTKKMSLIK